MVQGYILIEVSSGLVPEGFGEGRVWLAWS
jgi:hypothetical protein